MDIVFDDIRELYNIAWTTATKMIMPYVHVGGAEFRPIKSEKDVEQVADGLLLLERCLAIRQIPQSYWVIGKAYMALNRYEDAEKAYVKGLELDSKDESLLREYAYALLNMDNFKEALKISKEAIAVNPNDPGLICNLAIAHLMLGHIQEARKAVDYALHCEPNDGINTIVKRCISNVETGKEPCPRSSQDFDSLCKRCAGFEKIDAVKAKELGLPIPTEGNLF